MAANATALPSAPGRSQLSNYVVNREGWEAITATLYDYAALAATAVTTLSFFQTPNGSGGKTLSDTNMLLAGQMPTNQEFLVTSIAVRFFPTTPTVAAQMPAVFGAQAAAQIVNDAYIFWRSGNLTFTIGSKNYVQDAPMGSFPSKQNFDLSAALADTTTAAGSSQSRIAFAAMRGRPYGIIPVMLTSNQNFSVTLAWPEGAQTYTNPARVGVVLDGVLYRRSQ